MMNRFFFSTIGVEETVVEFDADYIMLKYTYTDGSDLDTRTKILSPVDSGYLGYSYLSRFPASGNIILEWGGDNTGAGSVDGSTGEAILINLINYRSAYPSNPFIQLDCRAHWFGSTGVAPVIVEATLWKGGTIVKGTPYRQFSNPTAESTVILDSVGVTVIATNELVPAGERVGIFSYEDTSNTGQFS